MKEKLTRQHFSSEEQACEDHFAQHTQRDNAACYIIVLLRRNISLENHEDVSCIHFSRSNENWYAIQDSVMNTSVVINEYDHKSILCTWAYDIKVTAAGAFYYQAV
jgi:hypothetical protein